ncbi:trypsin-like [Cimex lectularius]|uniref:Peptidase S1 domain-containing protein n=1 Tax=Cimex lectularius TaxID=79782 RepID=A0A8I6TGU8_CIMLE|nr:trypsin-like [Cimex lectularius]
MHMFIPCLFKMERIAIIIFIIILCYDSIVCPVPNMSNNFIDLKSLPRIVAGEYARIEEVPYIVRISAASKICTGAVIHTSWVLTAAHCIFTPLTPEKMKILAGIDDISNENKSQRRVAEKIVVHKLYVKNGVGFSDLALIKVNKPFTLSTNVAVLNLSNEIWPQDKKLQYNRPCLVVGWGSEKAGKKGSLLLKKLTLTARHGPEGCDCWNVVQNRNLVCLNANKGKGICSGDSGGPLVCDNKGVGVAHIIYRTKGCHLTEYDNTFLKRKLECEGATGAYMYLCPYLDWVNEHIPNTPKTPINCKGSVIENKHLELFIFFNLITLQLIIL